MKHYEFWNPRLFEVPYYAYLLWRCAVNRLPPKFLAKANWALDHGEIGIGSKFATQMAFDQRAFPATTLLPADAQMRRDMALTFASVHGYPLVMKPDQGSVGKGVVKVENEAAMLARLEDLVGPYLLQVFTPFDIEFGVFFVRQHGIGRVTGINQKHFPTVIGNGVDSIQTLAEKHERFTPHWRLFLQDIDTRRVPAPDESVQLSFIGSHTMGCKFTDETGHLTTAVERSIQSVCIDQPGFNFGRLDVKAESTAAFWRGEFIVIEINGVASLPTHMFDPGKRLIEGYRIFLEHGRLLAEIASEHRHQPMVLIGWRAIARSVAASQARLNRAHDQIIRRQAPPS